MKRIIALLAVVAATGCSSTMLKYHGLEIHHSRGLVDTKGVNGKLTDTNGLSIEFELKSSTVNTEFIEAATRGAAEGATK